MDQENYEKYAKDKAKEHVYAYGYDPNGTVGSLMVKIYMIGFLEGMNAIIDRGGKKGR